MDEWGLMASILAFLTSKGPTALCIGGVSLAAFLYQFKTLEVVRDKLRMLNEGPYLEYLSEASKIAFNLLIISLGERYVELRESGRWEEIREELKMDKIGFPEELRAALERQYAALRFLEELRDSIADLRSFHDSLRMKLYSYLALALVASLVLPYLIDTGSITANLFMGFIAGCFIAAMIANIGDSQGRRELRELLTHLNHLFNMRSGEEVYNYALRSVE
ncbi:MAG: hypothetical protein DRK00_10860 [Thermoprotei archaeon]|nr:MAG: hypothetical protein DRK00_10860 [Thermoprotei archaeon]